MRDEFIRFLKDEHAWDEFKENFEKFRLDRSLDEWLENPSIICAFPYDMTEQGKNFWDGLRNKWEEKNNRGKRMSWAVGFDPDLGRDIGYGVPSVCDHPDCSEEIDRGLGYVCGGLPYGGEQGCGLFFCEDHKELDLTTYNRICERCEEGKEPFPKKDDTNEWKMWKIMDESWEKWRESNPEAVASLKNDLQILHLTLKKQWFDEILSGNKKKEWVFVK